MKYENKKTGLDFDGRNCSEIVSSESNPNNLNMREGSRLLKFCSFFLPGGGGLGELFCFVFSNVNLDSFGSPFTTTRRYCRTYLRATFLLLFDFLSCRTVRRDVHRIRTTTVVICFAAFKKNYLRVRIQSPVFDIGVNRNCFRRTFWSDKTSFEPRQPHSEWKGVVEIRAL